jgi:hypothetical protein
MASMVQANQTNRAASAIKAEAIAAHQTSAEPFPYPPPRAVESKSIYPPSRARKGTRRSPVGRSRASRFAKRVIVPGMVEAW